MFVQHIIIIIYLALSSVILATVQVIEPHSVDHFKVIIMKSVFSLLSPISGIFI